MKYENKMNFSVENVENTIQRFSNDRALTDKDCDIISEAMGLLMNHIQGD